jgi:hypothetical protein
MRLAFLAVLLLAGMARAQENLAATKHVADAPSTLKFWSTAHKIDFSIFAGEVVADGITTQRGIGNGMREANPLARPLVSRGAAGQVAASTLGFGAGVGAAYLLHKTHHYKAERVAVRMILAVEGAAVAQNIVALR